MRFRLSVGLVGLWVCLLGAAHAQTTQPATPPTTPPAATPPGPVASAADTPGVTPDDATAPSSIRLRRLEQRVEALKEETWRVKARVGMLKEAVLGGGIGARASIQHQNKMGGSFRLIKLVYALDGTQIFSRTDESSDNLNDLKDLDILSGPIAPGNHTISVLVVYRGNGYGVFDYLKKYRFTVRTSHTFTVTEGKQTQVTVVGYEKGGITTPLEKRPAVDFKVNVISDTPGSAGNKPAASPSK